MSGGTFSKASRPIGAGTYFNFDIVTPPGINPSIGSIVALGLTHDWGPFKSPTAVVSVADFQAKFGGDLADPSSGLLAVYEAFKGEGLPGFAGASEVIVYRMGTGTAAKATHSISNTATTPAPALKLDAKYEGTRGNFLAVTTQDHAADPLKAELIVLDTSGGGSNVLEKYVYLDTDIASLAAQVNRSSRFLAATSLVTGTALANVTSVALTTGNDGATITSAEYADAMAALELVHFGVLSFEDLTDPAILASVASWTTDQNSVGRRFFLVVGGDLDETISDAVDRSSDLDDPDIINVGVGSVEDNDLLDAAGDPTVFSTAQLAPRIAGILAQRNSRLSLTFSKLVGLNLVGGATAADIVQAYDGGVLVLSRASDAQATVRVEKGISTYTTTTDATRPKAIFSIPKYVAVMHGIQTDLVIWADDNVIGKTTVDEETRAFVTGYATTLMATYEESGAIQSGSSTVLVDPDPPPSDDDEFVAVVIGAKFGRSTEQVYFTAQLG